MSCVDIFQSDFKSIKLVLCEYINKQLSVVESWSGNEKSFALFDITKHFLSSKILDESNYIKCCNGIDDLLQNINNIKNKVVDADFFMVDIERKLDMISIVSEPDDDARIIRNSLIKVNQLLKNKKIEIINMSNLVLSFKKSVEIHFFRLSSK